MTDGPHRARASRRPRRWRRWPHSPRGRRVVGLACVRSRARAHRARRARRSGRGDPRRRACSRRRRPRRRARSPAKDDATLAAGDTRLLGVFAERDGKGYALFRLPAGPRLVAPGQDIAQGAKLVAVRPDGVTMRDAGGERRVALRGEPAAPSRRRLRRSPRRSRAQRRLRAARRDSRARCCGSMPNCSRASSPSPRAGPRSSCAERGALTVRDDSGFVAMLAMKKGDRLAAGERRRADAPDDVVGAVLRPLAAQQPVRVIGARDGAPREWLLLNAGHLPG